MPKLTTTDLTALSSNETSSVNTINANFALVETAMENTLSRDGTATNTMTAALDMNSQKILNVASGTAAADGVNLSQLTAATGQVPGLSMTMETTQTDVDQGAGKVWFNAAVASATILYMDDADTNSADISTFVQTWDNSSNSSSRGYIYVIQKASAVNYAIYEIDGAVTDASGYTKIPVNYVIGAGTLADADPVTVNFIRTGDIPALPSIKMLFETATTDTDQGAGKLWLNNGTVGSATVLYMDDVDNAAGTSINSQVDSWDDSTSTVKGTITDQGVGKVWYNNGTVSSATVFYIDDVDANSASINSFVDSWDDSGSTIKGRLTVKKQTAPENFHMFNVNGSVTSASTYSKIPVAYVTSVGTISDADAVFVSFSRTGDKGTTGDTGATGEVSEATAVALAIALG
jgi:hypothetical protein